MMKRLTFAMMALLLAGAASAQDAAAPMRPPGFQTHDGFYLQLELGFGGMNSSASGNGNDLEFSGAGAQFGVALGGALTENFIVGGRIFATSVADPDVKLNGIEGTAEGSLGLTGYGLDLVYFFNPSNFYVGATPSITKLVATNPDGTDETSDAAFGLRLVAGKEWWVSDNWGLGLNLQYIYSSNKFGSGTPDFDTSWFGVNFSATFN